MEPFSIKCAQMDNEEPKAGKTRLNLHITPEFSDRLTELSERFGKRGRAHVAEEVLNLFVDAWEQSEIVRTAYIQQYKPNSSAVRHAATSGEDIDIEQLRFEAVRDYLIEQMDNFIRAGWNRKKTG